MNVTIFSNNTDIKQNIESYTSDIIIKQSNDTSSFFQEILFSTPNLLIIDSNEKEITQIHQKIKDENKFKDLPILFLVDNFNLKFFLKLGFNIGDIDYLQKPIEINQLISKINAYNNLFKTENKFTNIENFITKYSQSVIKGEMFGIISHQWNQPLNIIATSIINIELKSELDQITHKDIENCANKIHSTLERITNLIHSFENIFKPSLLKSDFNVNEALLKAVDLMTPQLNSHKIKILNNIPKRVYTSVNFENELCQSLLCLFSIIKDSIIKKNIDDSKFKGMIKLQIETKEDKIIIKIINKNIDISNELFKNSLSLNLLLLSSVDDYNTKLYIAKEIIENKLNGNLNIVNDTKDIIFTIII